MSTTIATATTASSPWFVVKSVGPKLVPFFKSVAVFFVLFPQYCTPTLLCLLTKCAPIFCLCLFVLMHGMSRDFKYRYSRRICLGLLLSMLGDACLVYRDELFIVGMLAFGIAHVIYFSAFGIKPFNFRLAFALVTLAVPICAVYVPFISSYVLKVAVPLYISLLFGMLWRAVSRLQREQQTSQSSWTWTKMCCSLGALCFVVSDSVLSFDLFIYPVPYSHQIVLLTYYAAQLGIALSIVDSYDERFSREVNDDVLQHEDVVRALKLLVKHVKKQTTVRSQQQRQKRIFLKKSASFIVVGKQRDSLLGSNNKSLLVLQQVKSD